MATTAFDSFDVQPGTRPPISAHPAFPAIVALWFSALLGLGSLVLPAVLLDRFVAATGLTSIIPAAAPPLGFTARATIAFAGTAAGALLGMAIARRVAKGHARQPEPPSARSGTGARRPISVHEEIGGDAVINGRGLPINRRRALAISEDDRPSDFLYRAPLPGEDPELSGGAFAMGLPDDEPLELCDALDEEPPMHATVPHSPADEDEDMIDAHELQPASPLAAFDEPAPESAAAEQRDVHLRGPGARGGEPLPFSPPSLARRAPAQEAEAELEVPAETVAEATAAVDESEFRGDWTTAPLERLGLVQLVQRLGSTIERRRELIAREEAAAPAPLRAAPVGFEAAPAEEAAQAMAAYFGSPAKTEEPASLEAAALEMGRPVPAVPAPSIMRPFAALDEDEGDEAVPDFSLPLGRPAAFAPEAFDALGSEAETDDDEVDAAEDGYSSLLGMRNPFAAPKGEFVRIDEPEEEAAMPQPAVVFPGQGEVPRAESAPAGGQRLFDPPAKGGARVAAPPQPAPVDADAALRAALATLQRMSGAA